MSGSAAQNVFNGSTLTFGSDVAALEDIEWSIGGQDVDIAGSDADQMEYGTGLDDVEVNFTVKGVTSISRGDTGDASVSWNAAEETGPCGDMSNAICTKVSVNGAKNGPITSKITLKATSSSS